jgi:predicted nucleotidyltransferase
MDREGAVEMDLVTHDARKYFTLLLKNNGYVLEQVFSPLIVHGGPDFDELRELARGCITKNHHYHYDRFALGQWQQVTKRPTVKGLLYTYRVLLAGIHLMRTAEVQANLRALNDEARLGFIDELIERKTSGAEKAELRGADLAMHEREFNSLRAALESAREASGLPEKPTSREGLSDLLVRLRLAK